MTDPKKMIAPLIIPSYPPNSLLTPPLTPSSPTLPHPSTATPPPPSHFLTLPRTALLGSGAWSHVYALTSTLAIKTPLNPTAHAILNSEARILAHLSTTPTPGLAPFHGFDEKTATIYMSLIPHGTLESHTLSLPPPPHIRAPAVGLPQWLFLADCLVRTFVALKQHRVVHGDVKWSNILLRPWTPCASSDPVWKAWAEEGNTLLEPVVVDFSSSHVVVPGELPEAVSAVTTSFAAPELLQGFLGNGAHPVPTFESDLYSLALSLLAAAVGSEVYGNAGRHVGIYVRQGNPIGWVKADERGLRVGRGGCVEGVLSGCFGKGRAGRVSVEEVGVRVEGWKRQWWTEGRKSANARWGC